MQRFALAAFAAVFVSAAHAIPVDCYQVLSGDVVIFIGRKEVPLLEDITEAVPGIEAMYCQLYFRDNWTYPKQGPKRPIPNGVPEAPALLHCIDPSGGEHSLPVEMDGMENLPSDT